MSHHRTKTAHATSTERRWAAAEGAVGAGLLGLGGVLLALAVLGLGAALLGRRPHSDAELLPLLGGVVPLGLGVLLRVAAGVMRRGGRNRWAVHWLLLAVPVVVAVVAWLVWRRR